MDKLAALRRGVAYALADDGRIGPNDVQALKLLSKQAGISSTWVDTQAEAYRPELRPKPRLGSGYGARVVAFEPGGGSTFNHDKLEVALGRPEGKGDAMGSLHVVSLGKRGRITLELGKPATKAVVVFENPFKTNGRVANPEAAKVEVSADGATWYMMKGK